MNPQRKILDLTELASKIVSLKEQGRKVVLCHGVFDLLHIGHLRHLREARGMGDVLVVTVTADQHVNKGPHRPAFPDQLRAEMLASLEIVDFVGIHNRPTALEVITALRPNIYVKGSEFENPTNDVTGAIEREAGAVRAAGGEMRFTHDITSSSSHLINQYLELLPPQTHQYLAEFRQQFSSACITEHLNRLRNLNVLVIGEAILDEYIFCDALGKSAKEPILAMLQRSADRYAGGSLAIANHLADFCGKIELLTYLGRVNSHEDFVRQNLRKTITPTFVHKANSPTILKRRYVDNYLSTKMLEVYEMNDAPISGEEEEQLLSALDEKLPRADVVLVADYGHGLITPRIADRLTKSSAFLAVNTQINAANLGFHTVSKYQRADFVCVHEGEVRLDQRDRQSDLRGLVTDLAKRLQTSVVLVTRGRFGTLLYHRNEGFSECPAFAVKVVDRIGAGDAVLAISAACIHQKMPQEIVGFIANLVGAQSVMILGNSTSIERVQLIKAIESLLK